MALSVVLTINSTPYDVADYVIKDSIIIDESLFNDKDLRPTTNKASFILSRDCPYIDELFAWADDVPITISLDGVLAFTGYLTDDHSLSIGTTGAREVKIDAEDPGIRKLKVSWVSTDTLSTIFNGDKVCDPADTGNSFVHILAALAGVNLATMPTISAPLYFTVKDSDSKDYWGILADVLFEHQYVFYFNAAGELALFSLATLTGTPAQMVSTSADVLAKNGDVGIKITKRLLTYKQVDVKFKEAETLAGATIYRDTTGQTAINDCNIEMAGGAYYPSTCDASTYAYIDYFLEDGREILSVDSAASDFVVDSGITAAFTNLGLSAQVRFLNTLGITADIRKLKVAGTNVVAVKAQSKVIAGESSKFKKEYEAKYLTDKTKATELANLLYYFYKNSSSTYKWRSYMGTLYPSETLFPATTLFPLGDLIALGEKIDLKDPVFSGLDVDVAVTKRKYRLGYYGADYEGVGIGTITLSSAVGYTPTAPAIVPGPKYLATKPLAADPAGATPDTADFVGQYGVYAGQRYTCTALPDTWALDDAGQTAAQVVAAVPVYVPRYLGPVLDGVPSYAKEGDVYLLYSETPNTVIPPTLADPPDHRGVFRYTSDAWAWTTDPGDMFKAIRDIVDICQLRDTATPPAPLYGVEADYGVSSSIDVAHIKTALIDYLRGGSAYFEGNINAASGTFRGVVDTPVLETTDNTDGETISAPSATHWAGSALVSHCSTLADGETAVDATSTFGGKNVTKIYKNQAGTNAVKYQGDDTERSFNGWYQFLLISNIPITGRVTISVDLYNKYAGYKTYVEIYKNQFQSPYLARVESTSGSYETKYTTITLQAGDRLFFNGYGQNTSYVKNVRICPVVDTIGVLNDTDNTISVIDNVEYYNTTGNINLAGLADFVVSYTHWLGSVFINLFDGKVRPYVEQAVDSGTFPTSAGKTAQSVYIAGEDSIRITHTDAATTTILAASYYSTAGTIVLADIAGGLLVKGADPDGSYKFTNSKIDTGDPDDELYELILQNRYIDKPHTILTIKNPDPDTTYHESTLSQLCNGSAKVSLHDSSMMDYSGNPGMFYRIKNFTDATYPDWEWDAYARVGGTLTKIIAMILSGASGNLWLAGNCSALSFTDRTPYPKDKAEAYEAVKSVTGKDGKVQHGKMHKSIQAKGGRDLSALVSAQNEVIKDLMARLDALEAK